MWFNSPQWKDSRDFGHVPVDSFRVLTRLFVKDARNSRSLFAEFISIRKERDPRTRRSSKHAPEIVPATETIKSIIRLIGF